MRRTEADAIPYEKKQNQTDRLFRGRRVLGDCLGALRDSVLGKFTGEDKTDAKERLEDEIV